MILAKAQLPDGTEFVLTEEGWNIPALNLLYPLQERVGYPLGEWQAEQLRIDFRGVRVTVLSRMSDKGPGMIF